jgi:hypothetical protein
VLLYRVRQMQLDKLSQVFGETDWKRICPLSHPLPHAAQVWDPSGEQAGGSRVHASGDSMTQRDSMFQWDISRECRRKHERNLNAHLHPGSTSTNRVLSGDIVPEAVTKSNRQDCLIASRSANGPQLLSR